MSRQSKGSVPRNCFTCQTRERTEWCVLDETELGLLNDAKVSREYLPGEVIFQEGDPCDGEDPDECENGTFFCNAAGDGVTCLGFGRMAMGEPAYGCATPQGIMRILEHYDVEIEGKHAVERRAQHELLVHHEGRRL